MGLPKDFDQKIPVTIGLIVWIAIMSFSLGVLYKSTIDLADEIIDAKAYTTQEVDGLRSDWEMDRKEQNRRLEKLENE